MNAIDIDALEKDYYSGEEWNWNRTRLFLAKIPKLIHEIEWLKARNSKLMETVESLMQVEFVEVPAYITDSTVEECPWCNLSGHTPDCPRRMASEIIRIFRHGEYNNG